MPIGRLSGTTCYQICTIVAQLAAFATTLWLRNPTMFTWKGLLAFSTFALVLFFLPKWDPVVLWAILIGSNLLWTVWGYKRYHTHFPIHPAFFGGMLLMIGCLGWGVNDPQHLRLNLLLFNLALPLLDVWLYRAASSGQLRLNDDAEANGE